MCKSRDNKTSLIKFFCLPNQSGSLIIFVSLHGTCTIHEGGVHLYMKVHERFTDQEAFEVVTEESRRVGTEAVMEESERVRIFRDYLKSIKGVPGCVCVCVCVCLGGWVDISSCFPTV